MGNDCFGDGVSFGDDGNVLELGYGDVCKTLVNILKTVDSYILSG